MCTSKRTHWYSITHTLFCLTYGMGRVYQKKGNNFSTSKTRVKIVPVVKLRHRKVVVVVDGIHKRNQRHAFVPVSRRQVVIFPKTLWSIIGGVEDVHCCCGACLRCCCFGRFPDIWKRSCWHVTDNKFLVASNLTCSLLLIANRQSCEVTCCCYSTIPKQVAPI